LNLLFIHAWNPRETHYRGKFSSFFSYPSLTLPALVALVPPELGYRVDCLDEMTQRAWPKKKHYDVVAISFDTSSSQRAYELAKAYKAQGSYILFGGYHTSNMPEEALLHAGSVVIGPAEISLPMFLRDFAAGLPQRVYDYPDVLGVPIPVPQRGANSLRKKLRVPTVIADRGCDNRCAFCAISQMWRSNPRPVAEVVDEIRALKTKNVIFFDPNFFAPKTYARELMTALLPLRVRWFANATADTAFDDDMLALAKKSGCRGVLIGLESVSARSLEGVGKRFRKVERYKEVVGKFHSHGIQVNGCFVLGFDDDVEESLLNLPRVVDELELDLTRFAILTPLPGSALFQELDAAGRIVSRDWSLYTQRRAVFAPQNMTPERLEAIFQQVWKETFSWKRVFARACRRRKMEPLVRAALFMANLGFKFLPN